MNLKFLCLLISTVLVLAGCTSAVKSSPSGEKQKTEEDQSPFLTKPKIRSYMVPDTIEGNKYIKSHRVYILDDPGSWSR